jgi:phosphoribosylformylglycinamidine synthase
VSHLQIPEFPQPWETAQGKPDRIASALDIMIEGPLGAAAFNNEFGRPNLSGYFRTFEQKVTASQGNLLYGYHKPIMIAGGLGNIRPNQVVKERFPAGSKIVVLGGPAMLIGLGGGAASSMASGSSAEDLDFASVQRGNPEMQRRCQEVINQCTAFGDASPILSIHDVGAGGLSNALPELIHDAGCGGRFELRSIPNDEPGMSPLELWCNESQERYVLAIGADQLARFTALCERERCPYAVLGEATGDGQLVVSDAQFDNRAVDMPLELLLGNPPKMLREVERGSTTIDSGASGPLELNGIDIVELAGRVLRLPAVASKSFLITIGDRTVSGLVARDQMVGPWQVPVADVAVTAADYQGYGGEAMAMGERSPVAVLDPVASGRLAIGEALTNICAARIHSLSEVCLSANWMAAAGSPGQDAALFDTVKAVGEDLCPALGIAIPVGKDSLSMKTVWREGEGKREMISPLSLVVSAFAPVQDLRATLTPELRADLGITDLILIDLGGGKNRLGESALAQVTGQIGVQAADLDDPERFKSFFGTIQSLNAQGKLVAYHDRSDGGLFATLCEMAFAGRMGLEIDISALGLDSLAALFSEELGAVIQVRRVDLDAVIACFKDAGLGNCAHVIGAPASGEGIRIHQGDSLVFSATRAELQSHWSETSYRIQALRDNPDTAREEFACVAKADDPGLSVHLSCNPETNPAAPLIATGVRPRVAILREQGVNGQIEMAAAFDRAGFAAIDVHMTDIIAGRISLSDFSGLAACGGFSYGDVLGAGGGWAKSILHNPRARDQFQAFFAREDVFGLGVCNGCQMLSHLKELIPGTEAWPRFVRNRSEQFEARLSLVEIQPSSSILFQGMAGSRLPIAVAHGEGRAEFEPEQIDLITENVAVRFVDNHGQPTEAYPANPNGSPGGITGLTNADGRFTIMMPHPERVFRTVQFSWHPDDWGEGSPWMRLFWNVRAWLG